MIRYRLLSWLLAPLALLWMLWRSRSERAWRRDWRQRFGFWPPRQDQPLWIHAASVGEVNSAASLLRELRRRYPELPLQLSAFTPSGVARWRNLDPDTPVALLPLDLPGAMRRLLRRLQPRGLILLEAELWPHLLQACARQGRPVLWLSARLSARTGERLQRHFAADLARQCWPAVRAVGAQSAADLERFAALGMAPERLHLTGSLKADLELPPEVEATGRELRAAWPASTAWLAASTHAGEESAVIAAHQALLAQDADALLLLAPRHPRRAAEVLALISDAGLRVQRRSETAQLVADTEVYLIDTLGELLLFYAAADFSFVGGSLAPIGGHNLREPAGLGRAMLLGPHLDSCRETADALVAAGAARIVADGAELRDGVCRLATAREEAATMGAAARRWSEGQGRALPASLALLDAELELAQPPR